MSSLRKPVSRTAETGRRLHLLVLPDETQDSRAAAAARRAFLYTAGLILVIGSLIRASFILSSDFPLNDGGMFYTMIRDLQANGYQLPAFTTYNSDAIPFAYPPLPFYVAAWVEHLTPLTTFDVLRILPLAASCGTLVAFALLARRLIAGRLALLAAMFAFAFTPFAFEWMIMGGGLTRSFGLLFALLALHECHRLYTAPSFTRIATTGVLSALVALSHPEMLLFLSFSTALFLLAFGRSKRGARDTALAAAIALLVSSPWWVTVLAYHGAEPFLAALTTSSTSRVNPVLTFLVFRPTDESMFAVIAALSLVGVAWSVSRGQWLLPCWILACGLFVPRGFGNVACVPVSMLAGVASAEVLLPMLQGSNRASRSWALPTIVFGFLLAYSAIGALVATPQLMQGLEPDERDAMAWVASHTPDDARVLVVTDAEWAADRTSEWFPVLANRRSMVTVQGNEWQRDEFQSVLSAYREAQLCAEQDANCLRDWQENFTPDFDFDYVFMPKMAEVEGSVPEHPDECCAALRLALRADPDFRVVFDGPGATVFSRVRVR